MAAFKHLLSVLAVLISLTSVVRADSNLASFGDRWHEKKVALLKEDSGLPEANLNILRNRHVLFIPGLMNELAAIVGSYFTTSMQSLGNLGVSTSLYAPSSARSISDNSELLYKRILNTHSSTGKPLILVGHSKGGAEVLLTMLNYPELLLTRVVDRVVLIQPAIGGSDLVEYDWWNLQMRAVNSTIWAGLESLNPKVVKHTFRLAYNGLVDRLSHGGTIDPVIWQKSLEEMRSKIFYVRSIDSKSNFGFGIRFVLNFVRKTISGSSDGVLLTEHQKFSPGEVDFGTDLGLVESDHIGLTVSYFGNKSELERSAFTLALFEQIYESESANQNQVHSRPSEQTSEPILDRSFNQAYDY